MHYIHHQLSVNYSVIYKTFENYQHLTFSISFLYQFMFLLKLDSLNLLLGNLFYSLCFIARRVQICLSVIPPKWKVLDNLLLFIKYEIIQFFLLVVKFIIYYWICPILHKTHLVRNCLGNHWYTHQSLKSRSPWC